MIRQELNPVTCKLDGKQINLRRYNPDRHCENGSISWRDGKNHQKDVTTSYATASRCITTVPFSWRDGQNHQMMWPPAMQQHPGASLRFHCMARRTESPIDVTTSYATASRCITTVPFRGETDRITTCRYKILRPVSHPPNVHSFVGTARTNGAVPPALVLWLGPKEEKERSFTSIQMLHTHLLRNILSNYWCGMHRTCKNTSVKPDRKWWMTRREKQCRGILSTSLLDATVPSDEVGSNSDCENRANRRNQQIVWKRLGGSWVSHVPLQKLDMKLKQVRRWASSSISQATDECLC